MYNAFPQGQRKQLINDKALSEEDATALALAEWLRDTISRFIRSVRNETDTPTTSQSETLLLLEKRGPLSVAELANCRNVRHQSMRLVTAQLETEGLVCRLPNPADGRSQLLSITEKGREGLSRSREARTSKIAALIEERLSEEDRRTLEAAIPIIERLC
ncbi:MarR family winged helix-turn-helix transcriptional regulator [Azospirillum oryzae]|nr:MarR family transcriptional regulator [Azospirillum oryzae]